MKVVKDGTKSWEKQVNCDGRGGCGSILQIEAADVRIGHFGANYGGDTGERHPYVECPVCKRHLVVEVPPWVDAQAEERSKKK